MWLTQEIHAYAQEALERVKGNQAAEAEKRREGQEVRYEGFVDSNESANAKNDSSWKALDVFIAVALAIVGLSVAVGLFFAYRKSATLAASVFAGFVVLYALMCIAVAATQNERMSSGSYRLVLGASIIAIGAASAMAVGFGLKYGKEGARAATPRPMAVQPTVPTGMETY